MDFGLAQIPNEIVRYFVHVHIQVEIVKEFGKFTQKSREISCGARITSSAVEARNRGGIVIDFLWSHDGGFESAAQMGAARHGRDGQ